MVLGQKVTVTGSQSVKTLKVIEWPAWIMRSVECPASCYFVVQLFAACPIIFCFLYSAGFCLGSIIHKRMKTQSTQADWMRARWHLFRTNLHWRRVMWQLTVYKSMSGDCWFFNVCQKTDANLTLNSLCNVSSDCCSSALKMLFVCLFVSFFLCFYYGCTG